MDVKTGTAVICLNHLLECPVRDGKERMSSEHGLYHAVIFFLCPFGEIGVLPDALQCLFLAVALGHLVAQAGAHPQLLRHILDGKEASWNLTEGGMVVEDRRHAVTDAVQNRGIGARFGPVDRQMTVDLPPGPVEHLIEIRRIVAVDGKSSRQSGVNMGMRIDEAGHNQLTVCINQFRTGILLLHLFKRADLADHFTVDHDSTVLQIRIGTVLGKNASISHQKHNPTSL